MNAIAFSPDGKLLATGSLDGPIGIWDAATWKPAEILRGHAEPVFELAFNSDGTKLISAGQHATLKLWDLTAKPGLRLFRARSRPATGDRAGAARRPSFAGSAASPFAPTEASLRPRAQTRRWLSGTCGSGRLDAIIQAPWGAAFALTYNHDGTRLAFAGSDRSVRIFDLKSDREPLIISDHRDGFASVAFSHDGKTLATGGGDPPEVIQEPIGKFSPAESDARAIRLWDAATGIERTQASPGTSARFTPWRSVRTTPSSPQPGPTAACGSGTSTSGEVVLTMKKQPNALLALAFSPDGTKLAAAGVDHTISVWDVSTGRLIHTLSGHTTGSWALRSARTDRGWHPPAPIRPFASGTSSVAESSSACAARRPRARRRVQPGRRFPCRSFGGWAGPRLGERACRRVGPQRHPIDELTTSAAKGPR